MDPRSLSRSQQSFILPKMPQGFAYNSSQLGSSSQGPSEGVDWGETFPTETYPGKPFYRTDLGERFYYDSGRSLWLAPKPAIQLTAGSDNDLVRNGNSTFTNVSRDGVVWPYAVMVLRWFGNSRQNQTETGTPTLYKNGATEASVSVAGTNQWDSGTLSLSYAAGDLLSANIVGSTTGNWVRVSSQIEIARIGS